ncbi:MAG: hypothetical protein AAGN64_02420 [Bacteroidota bacterium]
MANSLGGYSLIQFAQEAIENLESQLGIAGRIHRGYDKEPQEKGDVIQISKPGTFTAQDAPSPAQDVDTSKVNIRLTEWKDVVFKMTDKELDASMETIVENHIRPATYALALYADQVLAAYFKRFPWRYSMTADQLENILGPQEILAQNGVPVDDGMVHFGASNRQYKQFLGQPWMYGGDVRGNTSTLTTGVAQDTFGMKIHRVGAGVVQTHTSGTVVSAGNDFEGALNGAAAKGATNINIDGLSGAETLASGDSFVIAGHTQRYTVTAAILLAGGAAANVSIYPALATDYADDSLVTFEDGSQAANHADRNEQNLVYHRHAMALATAALQGERSTQQARSQGIEVETITDPDTQLALRAMQWYEAKEKSYYVSLDILFGYEILDPNKAVLAYRDIA